MTYCLGFDVSASSHAVARLMATACGTTSKLLWDESSLVLSFKKEHHRSPRNPSLPIIYTAFRPDELSVWERAEGGVNVTAGDDDLSAGQLGKDEVSPFGVKLGEDIVKEKYGIFARETAEHLALGELERQNRTPLLPP